MPTLGGGVKYLSKLQLEPSTSEHVLAGTPPANATRALLRLGSALSGASANGTYLGGNAPSGYTGDFIRWQLNGADRFYVDSSGNVVSASNFLVAGLKYVGNSGGAASSSWVQFIANFATTLFGSAGLLLSTGGGYGASDITLTPNRNVVGTKQFLNSHLGSGTDDTTQDAFRAQPSGTLSTFWRPYAAYASSGATTPMWYVTSAGAQFVTNALSILNSGATVGLSASNGNLTVSASANRTLTLGGSAQAISLAGTAGGAGSTAFNFNAASGNGQTGSLFALGCSTANGANNLTGYFSDFHDQQTNSGTNTGVLQRLKRTVASGTAWTGDFVHWEHGSDRKFRCNYQGRIYQSAPNAAVTDGDLWNGSFSAYLDEAANKLIFRVRYSDSTLKTGEIALT